MAKLPAKLHLKHGRYYYVHQNKWHPLERDYSESLILYARLIAAPSDKMPSIIDRAMSEIEPRLSANSVDSYRIAAEKLKKTLAEFSADQVRPMHVAQILDHYRAKPGTANVIRNVLKQVFERAVIWGVVDSNPVQFVKRAKTQARDRYITDDEFRKIRENASPTLACIMDILYATGQRIGDIRQLKLADISDDGISIVQEKTKHRMTIAMSPELADAIRRAKTLHRSVKGMTLFHTRAGQVISYSTIRTMWGRATEKAGITDANIHDIRAKAGTDAKTQGIDSKKLLGHTTDQSHNRYIRNKEIPVASPVALRHKSKS